MTIDDLEDYFYRKKSYNNILTKGLNVLKNNISVKF